ncbi:MAG: hypothetical protein K0M69_08280 [Youngiibacter sp.]|nr:hypothetical protein [Youngiibacter sp.]
MGTNAIADTLNEYLLTKHQRVYRNRPVQNPVFPYVVYKVESSSESYPSEDLYVHIDIYEDSGKGVRDMEDLADTIDDGLNHNVINNSNLNLQFEREVRQYISPAELVTSHLVSLRYFVRAYFK